MAECAIGNLKIHVEVPLLLIFFGFILSEPVKTNLIIYRTCYVTLGYNESECALLGSKTSDNETAKLEELVQPHASVIGMTHSLLEGIVCSIICFFAGSWSDRFGRKPILVIPLIGYILAQLWLAIFSILKNISPWYSLIASVPIMLTGGLPSYLTVVLCYVTDVTSEANRGVRMAWFEASLSIGILLGNLSSSYIFYATSYAVVFCLAALCFFIALLFTLAFIPESLTNRETQGKFSELFDASNISDMVTTSFKKRRHYDRFVVLSCIMMLTLYIIVMNADGSVLFLYLRDKFQWSLETYTLYNSSHNVAWILGTLIGVHLLHKVFNIPETYLVLIGFISMFNSMVLQALAVYDWEIFTAGIIRCLGGVLSPLVRSLVTKIVPAVEVGKVFSLIVTCESLFGMLGSPLYTAIYNSTITTNPSVFNYVSVGIYFLEVLIATAVIFVRSKTTTVTYDELNNESNENNEIVNQLH